MHDTQPVESILLWVTKRQEFTSFRKLSDRSISKKFFMFCFIPMVVDSIYVVDLSKAVYGSRNCSRNWCDLIWTSKFGEVTRTFFQASLHGWRVQLTHILQLSETCTYQQLKLAKMRSACLYFLTQPYIFARYFQLVADHRYWDHPASN